ncbi:MAG TPA: indole-3-glycerol phosphate synthase TrpC [Candidatus Acidoferrales bacterium]|nr:indole-3-glycerol phosphate synthase TrpC [Candidatus Acidoferrales bacterium]
MMHILETIVQQKKLEVARLPERLIAAGDLRDAMLERGEPRDFLAALRRLKPEDSLGDDAGISTGQQPLASAMPPAQPGPASGHQPAPPHVGCHRPIALIAEVKKASPSAGVICPDFDPVRIAKEYEAAGADCLSVLTDEKFFQGSLDYLRQIRAAVTLPLLRKDFIIDERQILEAIEWGADAILLIVAILTDERLAKFHSLAIEAGLAALVEVHDEDELERALRISPALVGVNNRNLKTFEVDLTTTERLSARMQAGRSKRAQTASASAHLNLPPLPWLVAESGIHTRADVERVQKCGATAILVGESLVKHRTIGAKVRELLGA